MTAGHSRKSRLVIEKRIPSFCFLCVYNSLVLVSCGRLVALVYQTDCSGRESIRPLVIDFALSNRCTLTVRVTLIESNGNLPSRLDERRFVAR